MDWDSFKQLNSNRQMTRLNQLQGLRPGEYISGKHIDYIEFLNLDIENKKAIYNELLNSSGTGAGSRAGSSAGSSAGSRAGSSSGSSKRKRYPILVSDYEETEDDEDTDDAEDADEIDVFSIEMQDVEKHPAFDTVSFSVNGTTKALKELGLAAVNITLKKNDIRQWFNSIQECYFKIAVNQIKSVKSLPFMNGKSLYFTKDAQQKLLKKMNSKQSLSVLLSYQNGDVNGVRGQMIDKHDIKIKKKTKKTKKSVSSPKGTSSPKSPRKYTGKGKGKAPATPKKSKEKGGRVTRRVRRVLY